MRLPTPHGLLALLRTMRTRILILIAMIMVAYMLFWWASDNWPKIQRFNDTIRGMIIPMILLVLAPTAPTRWSRTLAYVMAMVTFSIFVFFAIRLI